MNSISLVVLLILVPVILLYEFPEKFELCHKNDPDLDTCLKRTIQNALKLIGSNGISSLNLPPIDPLRVPQLDLGVGSNVATFYQNYSDIQVLGFSSSEVEHAHLNLDKNELTFTLHMAKLVHKANYEVGGKLNLEPLYGKGYSVNTLYDLTLHHSLNFEKEIKNGKSHFRVKSYKLSINPNKLHFEFDNLFGDDQQRAAKALQAINDNWKEIFDNIKEELDGKYAQLFKFIANGLFDAVPVDEIFLN